MILFLKVGKDNRDKQIIAIPIMLYIYVNPILYAAIFFEVLEK